jgi:hypothetical protein
MLSCSTARLAEDGILRVDGEHACNGALVLHPVQQPHLLQALLSSLAAHALL